MSSTLFSGSSRFSADFASVIQRSVAIASLPLTQYQQQRQRLQDRGTALANLETTVAALQTSIEKVGKVFTANSLSVTNPNTTALKVTSEDGAAEGQYSIGVNDLGSATTFVVSGFPPTSDPDAPTYTSVATQTLLIDTDPSDGVPGSIVFTLTPGTLSLQALVDEINSEAGSSVRAAAVNVGTSSSPNYQLSLQSTKLGSFDITLTDGARTSTNSTTQRGSAVRYTANGANVTSDSRTVTIAPHLKVDLAQVTTSTVDISVKKSANSIKSALQSFVASYNGVVDEISGHRLNAGSALKGDSILGSVSDTLRRLIDSQSDSGTFRRLSDLGIGFDSSYKLVLESEKFDEATTGKLDELKSFIGTAKTSGLSKTLQSLIDNIEDDDKGALKLTIRINKESIESQDVRIATQQERIDLLQKDLESRMAAADAAIAMLEQQADYFNSMFAAMKTNQSSYNG